MDDDQQAVKPDGEEAIPSESPTEEPKATEEGVETPETPKGEAGVEGEEAPETGSEAPKKGAESRIKELNAKAKRAEEKAKSLEERVAELTGQVSPQAPQAPYTPQVEPGTEISPEQYKQDVLNTANALVDLRIKQSQAIGRIESEASEAMRKYPQLDPKSDQYNSELSESVTEAAEAYIRTNPYSASVLKFVDKLMKPYSKVVTQAEGKAAETIARQVTSAATRPTAVSTRGGKKDSEKSMAELEAELGFHY